MMRILSLLLAALLAGCAAVPPVTTTEGGVPIDTRYTAQGQDSRVLFLILHYTVGDLAGSMKTLTEDDVSAHYLLSDESPPRIYRLVDENRRAWHSGRSTWQGHRLLNASSIGIEIVHPGFTLGPDNERVYQPFPEAQIDALMDEIAAGLSTFHDFDGTPAVRSVERVADRFGTGSRADLLPDLIVRWSDQPATALEGVRSDRFGTVRRHGVALQREIQHGAIHHAPAAQRGNNRRRMHALEKRAQAHQAAARHLP